MAITSTSSCHFFSGLNARPQSWWHTLLVRAMGRELVPFPHDSPNWALVRDLLTELQERLLNETINAEDAAMHMQVCYYY